MRVRDYRDYAEYVEHQIKKTNKIKDGTCGELASFESRKAVFAASFSLLKPCSGCKALCLGSRRGEEVSALWDIGFDAIGIDLVAFPPFVFHGDMHNLPYWDNSVSFIYSNSVDHVLDLKKFASEVCRVLAPKGCVMFHLQINQWSDEVANSLESIEEFIELFPYMTVLQNRSVTEFFGGLNHLLVLRK